MQAIRTATKLTALSLARLIVKPERMREALERTQSTMTSLANFLVIRHGLAFRTAHEAVARLVQQLEAGAPPAAGEIGVRLATILGEMTGRALVLDPVEIEQAIDPARCVEAACHGGGPAADQVQNHLRELGAGVERLATRVAGWRRALQDAEAGLREAVDGVLRGEDARNGHAAKIDERADRLAQ